MVATNLVAIRYRTPVLFGAESVSGLEMMGKLSAVAAAVTRDKLGPFTALRASKEQTRRTEQNSTATTNKAS